MSGELYMPAIARLLARGPASIVDREDRRGVQGWWEPAALCFSEVGFAKQFESLSLYRGMGRYEGQFLQRRFSGERPRGRADGIFSVSYYILPDCDAIFCRDEVMTILDAVAAVRPPQRSADIAEFLTVQWPVDVFQIRVNWEKSLNHVASTAYSALVKRVSQLACERVGVFGHLIERFKLSELGQNYYWPPHDTGSFSEFLSALEEEFGDQ